MYFIFIIILIAIIAYSVYKSTKANFNQPEDSSVVDEIESDIFRIKYKLFELEYFDSPYFIDYQNAYTAMEENYALIKKKLSSNFSKVIEIARDFHTYVLALLDLKYSRLLEEAEWDEEELSEIEKNIDEPEITKKEIENKFRKKLKKEEWQEIPPNYETRQETMFLSEKDAADYEPGEEWRFYYQDSNNLKKLEKKRSQIRTKNIRN